MYSALVQALESGDSAIACHEMKDVFPTLLENNPETSDTLMQKQFEVSNTRYQRFSRRNFYLAMRICNMTLGTAGGI